MKFLSHLSILFLIGVVILSCKKENGVNGYTSLIKTSAEPAGGNCSSGGFKIETGLDKNNNNLLDTNEVSNASYICNGSNSNEPATLIRVSEEKAGTNCSNGGYKVETGPDTNKNGTLDEGEVTKTTYICSKALSYSAVVNQSGTQAPQSNVVENSMELTITWTRTSAGKYVGKLNKSVDLAKTIILSTNDRWVKCGFQSDNEIYLIHEDGINSFVDGISNYSLQIKMFN